MAGQRQIPLVEPPLLSDFELVLSGMEGSESLVQREPPVHATRDGARKRANGGKGLQTAPANKLNRQPRRSSARAARRIDASRCTKARTATVVPATNASRTTS